MLRMLAIILVTTDISFSGLGGHAWYSGENYLKANGRTQKTSGDTKWCSKFSGKLECKVMEQGKPDYYRLECYRDRRVCEGAIAVFLPSGEPWLEKVQYRISEWTQERVSAVMESTHPCVVTMLQIDLGSREVLFTETYTKSVENDPYCIPENIGHTTTYKLENY